MYEVNLALVAKLGWQFVHCPGKYSHQSPINPSLPVGNCSVVWNGIMQAAPLLKEGLCLLPRNGSMMRVQVDPWLLGGVAFHPIWRPEVRFDPSIQFVSDLVRPREREWNMELLRYFFENVSVEEILRMQVPNPTLEDTWIWTKEKSRLYSVKPMVLVEQSRTASERTILYGATWGRLWKLKLQDRLKLLLWKVAAGALKTKGALARIIHCEEEEGFLCPFCHLVLEDTLHLLVGCSIACIFFFFLIKTHLIHSIENYSCKFTTERTQRVSNKFRGS